MSTSVKIGVIGAGSATFSLGLVKDLCLTESLYGSTVSFMDIDEGRLDMIHKLASRYAEELSVDIKFEKTTERAPALKDADFVINTAAVRGHELKQATQEIGAKYGYYGYYWGPNVGNFYQLRLMLDIAREVEQVSPNAWLIQCGNPVFDGCTLITRETGINVCGLCHGHYGYRTIAATIGIDPDEVTFQASGLNHNIWMTHFVYENSDAYPLIDEWIETRAEPYWQSGKSSVQMSRSAIHQYQMSGLFPIGDTPRGGGWWYHTDMETKKRWLGGPTGGPDSEEAQSTYMTNLTKRIDEMAKVASDPKTMVTEVYEPKKTREQQVPIMDALVNNNAGEFQVNIPNRGVLEGLPDDVVVEVPAIVDIKGIQPICVGSLPQKVMLEKIFPHWIEMERGLLSFKTGDKSMLLLNTLQDHRTRSYDEAMELIEDLLSIEGCEEAKAHYGYPWK